MCVSGCCSSFKLRITLQQFGTDIPFRKRNFQAHVTISAWVRGLSHNIKLSRIIFLVFIVLLLCNAVACPHLERSGMSTACSRSASAHLYHTDGRLTSCDGAATDCI